MNILEQIMKDNNITRSDLAKALEIRESYLSMLMTGKRKISKPLALKIKQTFNYSLDEIFFADTIHRTRIGRPKNKSA